MIKNAFKVTKTRSYHTYRKKKGNMPCFNKNYRPITLLDVDYKILSKVLAKRIKEVLGEVIHQDQGGCLALENPFAPGSKYYIHI